mmetsp:Transcript_11753/g.24859  ORF Transcript_11753/g.24859 Transcript_11753/m.24859 type:complete len:89 (+) Transcript_11753:1838-2104(+)
MEGLVGLGVTSPEEVDFTSRSLSKKSDPFLEPLFRRSLTIWAESRLMESVAMEVMSRKGGGMYSPAITMLTSRAEDDNGSCRVLDSWR